MFSRILLSDWSEAKWKLFSHVQLFATPWTVHGILQARILEWVAFPLSRGSSQPRYRTQVSHTAGEMIFASWATGKPSPRLIMFLFYTLSVAISSTFTAIMTSVCWWHATCHLLPRLCSECISLVPSCAFTWPTFLWNLADRDAGSTPISHPGGISILLYDKPTLVLEDASSLLLLWCIQHT